MGKWDGSPTVKDYQDTLLVSVFSSRGPPSDTGRGPLASQEEVPLVCLDPLVEVHLVLLEVVLQVPLVTQDPQSSPRQSFIWQSGLSLDYSIADMNRLVMQLLTAQQAANAKLQLQTQQNQAVQIAHMDALRSQAESTQYRNFDHIFASIPTYDGQIKKFFLKWVERLDRACLQS